jgi:hypothetical protein
VRPGYGADFALRAAGQLTLVYLKLGLSALPNQPVNQLHPARSSASAEVLNKVAHAFFVQAEYVA